MFDTYEMHAHKTEVVDRHVTINRAPTDESVELLKEMQEQIKKDFLGKFPLDNNLLQATVFVMQDPLIQNINILVRYKLNYEDREVKIVLGFMDLISTPEIMSYEMLSLRMIQAVSEDIAKVFIMHQHHHAFKMPLLTEHKNQLGGSHFTLNTAAVSGNKNPQDATMKFDFIRKWLDMSNPGSWELREKLKNFKLF